MNKGPKQALRIFISVVLIYFVLVGLFILLLVTFYFMFGEIDANEEPFRRPVTEWLSVTGIWLAPVSFAIWSSLPFLLGIAISEWNKINVFRFFLASAFVSGGFATIAMEIPRYISIPRSEWAGGGASEWLVFCILTSPFSFLFACSYWVTAGRYAGLWRDAKAGNQH